MVKITNEMSVSKAIELNDNIELVLANMGIPLSYRTYQVETLEMIALVHGFEPDEFIRKINEELEKLES